MQSAVNCLDHPEHESVAQIETDRAAFVAASPVFGPIATWFSYGCSNWPIKPTLPEPDYSAPGAAPILVVGTTRDPATPYQQAVNLANELDSGVLLTPRGRWPHGIREWQRVHLERGGLLPVERTSAGRREPGADGRRVKEGR